jgi:hypothetical protein
MRAFPGACLTLILAVTRADANEINDIAVKLDTSSAQAQTQTCRDAQANALAYNDNVGGRIADAAARGLLGQSGAVDAADADKPEAEKAVAVIDGVISQCGLSALLPYFQRSTVIDTKEAFQVGYMFEQGARAPKDLVAAAVLYQEAADRGLPAAEDNLAALYEVGGGVPRDNGKAVALWTDAAGKNDPIALTNLGSFYYNGIWFRQDYTAARDMYRKGALLGHASAQALLATMTENGQGGEQSDAEAYKWYRIAYENGATYAAQGRERLAAKLTPDLVKKEDVAASRCMSTNYKDCL